MAAFLKAALAAASLWRNTSTGIHSFLTFDSGLTAQNISDTVCPSTYDFVWGAGADHVSAYRSCTLTAGKSSDSVRNSTPATPIVLSYYTPYSRDCSHGDFEEAQHWYVSQNRTSWIMYKCDKVTPAWYGSETNRCVPLDISNPEVVAWQLAEFAEGQAQALGYDAVAADNYGLDNDYEACGVWSAGETGTEWVPKWTGAYSDAQWTASALSWLGNFSAGARELESSRGLPIEVVPNYGVYAAGGRDANDPDMREVIKLSGAIVDEAGFTEWGEGRSDFHELSTILGLYSLAQASGVPYFVINELSESDISSSVAREWVVACYLLANQGLLGLFLTGVQDYGGLQEVFPEIACGAADGDIGAGLGAPVLDEVSGLWTRSYSGGFVAVNPGSVSVTVLLDQDTYAWRDCYGELVDGEELLVKNETGKILLKSARKSLRNASVHAI